MGISSAKKFASDAVSGEDFQEVKIVVGPDGTALPVTHKDPLPVVGGGGVFEAILAELRLINAYNEMAHNSELKIDDVQGD